MKTYYIPQYPTYSRFYSATRWRGVFKKFYVEIPDLNARLETKLTFGENWDLYLHQANLSTNRVSIMNLGYLSDDEIDMINHTHEFGFNIPSGFAERIRMARITIPDSRMIFLDLDDFMRSCSTVFHIFIKVSCGLSLETVMMESKEGYLFIWQATPDGNEMIRLI